MKLIDSDSLLAKIREAGASWMYNTPSMDALPIWADVIRTIKNQPASVDGWHTGVPDNEDRVLVCTENKAGKRNVLIGYYMSGLWHCGMNSNVVAWMPLPEVPND